MQLRLLVSLLFAASFGLFQPAFAQMPADPKGDDPQINMPDISQDIPLDEDNLIAAFSGKTHRGSYNFSRENIETFAFEETTSKDGKTRHTQGRKVDTGTWRVRHNVICFAYDNWEGVDQGADGTHRACFNVYTRGNCFYHYSVSRESGRRGGYFTARTVHAGETPDCEPAYV